jgi:hypothetical protein
VAPPAPGAPPIQHPRIRRQGVQIARFSAPRATSPAPFQPSPQSPSRIDTPKAGFYAHPFSRGLVGGVFGGARSQGVHALAHPGCVWTSPSGSVDRFLQQGRRYGDRRHLVPRDRPVDLRGDQRQGDATRRGQGDAFPRRRRGRGAMADLRGLGLSRGAGEFHPRRPRWRRRRGKRRPSGHSTARGGLRIHFQNP